jgi:thiamine-phosphate diphosphorylase
MASWSGRRSGRPARLANVLPHLHAVTNDQILALSDLQRRAQVISETGPVALHVRARTTSVRRILDVAREFRDSPGSLFVNDRIDIAIHVRSVGVHLPSDGVPTAIARQLLGPEVMLGRSTHSSEEARAAHEEGADYVFLGPIWSTASHPGAPGLGPGAIAQALPARVVAIGGITPDRVPLCVEHGAAGVAAISALWHAPDPAAAAAKMLVCFGG